MGIATVRSNGVTNPSIAAEGPELEPSGAEESTCSAVSTAAGRSDEQLGLREKLTIPNLLPAMEVMDTEVLNGLLAKGVVNWDAVEAIASWILG
ncbi:hypothetical protein CTAM01_13827 [Colletotrichum tamarilloi]|uniref:Uncharacterized protein n=1 Tax=Colletotrichum tamarilloi TaxID=1209934 RepID=A0ABQ9QQU7_9PEZI|nr:uncharacterized protein CTAM01_13827 [Colletotrichum tamarilloi]KAK1481769.1 hypothetical protein CTAM01_13827 [Colletotrichum tamarilloi]